jgi:hypothetical protein
MIQKYVSLILKQSTDYKESIDYKNTKFELAGQKI